MLGLNTTDDQLMEKMNLFCKNLSSIQVKILNHNICMYNLNSIQIQIKSNSISIFFFLNGMQIDVKIIENVFYDVRKNNNNKIK
jgi:hypothetical protein